ncbi:unnamed protein product [Ilex paraguariensis]|uniref:Protein TIFY n=1 Tax=Ilex paraguariensis TaxID=185542 RepID=A0ABC8RHC1_9AQUA
MTMARSAVELDFFSMEKEIPARAPAEKLFHRRRSFRDIQSVISKINPEVLKTVIASGSVNQTSMAKLSENDSFSVSNKSFSVPSTPKEDQSFFPVLPVYTPIFRPSSGSENGSETAPLTIFYNGTVSVFDVPRHKAENILKLAEENGSKSVEQPYSKLAVPSRDQRQLFGTLYGDLPISRRKSLQRFLEKRKERLTLVTPYGCPADYAFWGGNMEGYKD